MSLATATARSSASSSPSQKHRKVGHKQTPKGKSGKKPSHQRYHKGPKNDHSNPKHKGLLHRLSLPSSSPSGTLLERIGGSAADEAAPGVIEADRIDGRVSHAVDAGTDLPFSAIPHYYTPEPGEVERFLESVIGAPPTAPEPSGPLHTCLGDKPALAPETHSPPVDHLVSLEDPSSSALYSPTQTAVNFSLQSANLALDHFCQQSPLLGDAMPLPSTPAIDECRKCLVPVLLASAQARCPRKLPDLEQCLGLLSDDQCESFVRQAKEMRRQLASLVSQRTPVYHAWSSSLKRDRGDEMDAWVRDTRSRHSSMNTVVSEVSRRDSDITLVDFAGGKLPPKAPRAMLQASQVALFSCPNGAQDEAPIDAPQVASPTAEDHPAGPPLIELVHRALKMFPTLVQPTNQPAMEVEDASSVSARQPTADQLGHPTQVVSPTSGPVLSGSTDFVSRLPTQPGIWFRQVGRPYAEIVDVDIEVSDEMFYAPAERIRMYLRLCSVPVGAVIGPDGDDALASLRDVDRIIECHALHWPKKGKLVVQVNPESGRSKTWLPYTLESDSLDVTSCMCPGKNTFRFIQLSDLSGYMFFLAASSLPPEEAWQSWDWASLVARSCTSTASSTTTGGPANDLSEFADLPVVIRS